MVQLQLKVAHVTNSGKGKDSKLEASVNGVKLTTKTRNITSYQWHNVVVELPIDFVKQGTNKVVLSLADNSAPLFVQTMQLLPPNIYAENGKLNTTLFAQFGAIDHVTGTGNTKNLDPRLRP